MNIPEVHLSHDFPTFTNILFRVIIIPALNKSLFVLFRRQFSLKCNSVSSNFNVPLLQKDLKDLKSKLIFEKNIEYSLAEKKDLQ